MAGFIPKLQIMDINGVPRDISDSVTRANANYTIDGGGELKFTVHDEELKYLQNGYFQLDAEYENSMDLEKFKIASLEVSQGEGFAATVSIEARSKVFQELKSDMKPQVYKAANGFEFAQKIALKYGLNFYGEAVVGKQNTIKVKTKQNTESTWQVLQRAAQDNQYMCFITKDTLFFCSPKTLLGAWGTDKIEVVGTADKLAVYPESPKPYIPGNIDLTTRPIVTNPDGSKSTVRSIIIGEDNIYVVIPTVVGNSVVPNAQAVNYYKTTGLHLGKFGKLSDAETYSRNLHDLQAVWMIAVSKNSRVLQYVPLVYPTREGETRFLLTELPSFRKSTDSHKQGEGSAKIFGSSARELRPGMTVMVQGVNEMFNEAYIITSVDFPFDESEPVSINFATVSKLAPEDKATLTAKIAETTVISGTGGK